MRSLWFLWVVSLLDVAGSAQPPDPKVLEQAARESRLSPREFPGLPDAISRDLESRGCTIPQSYAGPRPHNVIQGEFHQPGQMDWAVLCSRDGESSILVYSGSSDDRAEEIGKGWKEHVILEKLEDGERRVEFHRKINAVGERFILEHQRAYGGPAPPPIDHQGINDAYVEKGSTVHYWHEGSWRELTGED